MRILLALIVLSLCVGVADAAQRHKRIYNRAPQRIDNRAPPIHSTLMRVTRSRGSIVSSPLDTASTAFAGGRE
jgi:hypothetical protein